MNNAVGIMGLGTMGSALARNIASRGLSVSVWNRTPEKVTDFVTQFPEGNFFGTSSVEEFVNSLEKPRRILLMIPAGAATDEVLSALQPFLEKDDVLMDGGNALYSDTEAMQAKWMEHGVHFLGCGVSGGEEGALKGPSIMPGGTPHAWEVFAPVLTAIAAKDFNGGPCVAYMGKGGAGHYVKMVHNGIEYAEMQMLAEAYDLLARIYKLTPDQIADQFELWSKGRMASFLVDISIDVLRKKQDGQPLIDLILDRAAQKGTGRWTSEEALKLGVPTPSITNAVFMRGLSADKALREELAPLYPTLETHEPLPLEEFLVHLEKALFASRLSQYVQGFALLMEADKAYEYGLNFQEIVRIWQGGCIIRSAILSDIHAAFAEGPKNLYLTAFAQKALAEAQASWRKIVAAAALHGVPLSSISASLTHFESYRTARGSAQFIQGLRDRFGSHGYERVDQPGAFHTLWS